MYKNTPESKGLGGVLVRKGISSRQEEYMVDKLKNYTNTRPRLRKIMGWSFVVVGFIALILPIIPGAPLVFIGFELLGLRFLFTDTLRKFFFKKRDEEVITS